MLCVKGKPIYHGGRLSSGPPHYLRSSQGRDSSPGPLERALPSKSLIRATCIISWRGHESMTADDNSWVWAPALPGAFRNAYLASRGVGATPTVAGIEYGADGVAGSILCPAGESGDRDMIGRGSISPGAGDIVREGCGFPRNSWEALGARGSVFGGRRLAATQQSAGHGSFERRRPRVLV